MSSLVMSQKCWKKAIGKPSGTGALSPSRSKTAVRTSSSSKPFSNRVAFSMLRLFRGKFFRGSFPFLSRVEILEKVHNVFGDVRLVVQSSITVHEIRNLVASRFVRSQTVEEFSIFVPSLSPPRSLLPFDLFLPYLNCKFLFQE